MAHSPARLQTATPSRLGACERQHSSPSTGLGLIRARPAAATRAALTPQGVQRTDGPRAEIARLAAGKATAGKCSKSSGGGSATELGASGRAGLEPRAAAARRVTNKWPREGLAWQQQPLDHSRAGNSGADGGAQDDVPTCRTPTGRHHAGGSIDGRNPKPACRGRHDWQVGGHRTATTADAAGPGSTGSDGLPDGIAAGPSQPPWRLLVWM